LPFRRPKQPIAFSGTEKKTVQKSNSDGTGKAIQKLLFQSANSFGATGGDGMSNIVPEWDSKTSIEVWQGMREKKSRHH